MNNLQTRINYQGDLRPVLEKVCQDFSIGHYSSHEIIPIGYEDFNLAMKTDKGNYFVKIFGTFRSEAECRRYIDVIVRILDIGVSHPKLFKSNQGYLYKLMSGGKDDHLSVMELIDGKTFYDLRVTPTKAETVFIVQQAAKINSLSLNPPPVYDNWAITSFLEQYEKKSQFLSAEDNRLIQPLVEKFKALSIDKLPDCFVHGDITKTNCMRGKNGKIYIIDFAVANYYPRLQELAVLLCDLLSDYSSDYDFVLDEYQKYIKLTELELKSLPTYIMLAHAMHVICASYEKFAKGNQTQENEYFLNIGEVGLRV